MSIQVGIPKAAMNSLSDMVDNVAEVKPGMQVLILAAKDGLYNGDNLVDEEAVAWTASVLESRGATCFIMWYDDTSSKHDWKYPAILKAAVREADLVINMTFNLTTTENPEYRKDLEKYETWCVPMFPTTSTLLMSEWAQTPYELVTVIRHVASRPFMNHMAPFTMTDPNGTHLEGFVLDPVKREGIPGLPYDSYRKQVRHVAFWPEWVHPPVNCKDVNGVYYFDRMLSFWSRYINIPPEWDDLVRVDVENSRIVKISGCKEALLIDKFLSEMEEKLGDGMRKFDMFHFGVHPNAHVEKYECPNDVKRRFVEHSHYSNVHWHLGSAGSNENYGYYPHITADIRHCSLTVGSVQVYDNGFLCCLNDPEVIAVAKKYPDRPTLQGLL